MGARYQIVTPAMFDKLKATALEIGEHLAYVMIMFGWQTGLTLEGTLALEWGDIDLDGMVITVKPLGNGSHTRNQSIPIAFDSEFHHLLNQLKTSGAKSGQNVINIHGNTSPYARRWGVQVSLKKVYAASGIKVAWSAFRQSFSFRSVQYSAPLTAKAGVIEMAEPGDKPKMPEIIVRK